MNQIERTQWDQWASHSITLRRSELRQYLGTEPNRAALRTWLYTVGAKPDEFLVQRTDRYRNRGWSKFGVNAEFEIRFCSDMVLALVKMALL